MTDAQPREGWIVMPAHNEERSLPATVGALASFLRDAVPSVARFVVLVVDDGSTDRTAEVMGELAREYAAPGFSVRCLSLLRNFGHQAALKAGLQSAAESADFAVTMDADGEHPIEVIPELIEIWRAGAAIVHTVRRPDRRLGIHKRATSYVYYKALRGLSGLPIEPGMADFKLWDGDLLRQIQSALPGCGSTRVFAVWLAPGTPRVSYTQRVAAGRVSRFTSRKQWSLALDGLTRFSDLPLRSALFIGLVSMLFAGGLIADAAYAVASGRAVPGWASTLIALAVFCGLQSFSFGILSEYLLRNWFRRALPAYVLKRRQARVSESSAVMLPHLHAKRPVVREPEAECVRAEGSANGRT